MRQKSELEKLPANIQALVRASDELQAAIWEWRTTGIPGYKRILAAQEAVDTAAVALAYEAHDKLDSN